MRFNPLPRLRRGVITLPAAAVAAAALVVVLINEAGHRESTAALFALVERSDMRAHIQAMLRGLVDAETGQRGYLLTGRESYLAPYQDGIASVDTSLRAMRSSPSDAPVAATAKATAMPELQVVERKALEKLSELATTIDLYKQGKHEQWRELLLSDIGREKMDEVRATATTMRDAETGRIQVLRDAVTDVLQLSRIGVNLMALVALASLLLFLRQTRELGRFQLDHSRALGAERDRLESEVLRRTAELTELTQHLETAREDERARLARELHDELGALLTAAKLDAARLRRTMAPMPPAAEDGLKHLNATLDRGIALKRNIIEDLRPSSLANLGLVAALEIEIKEFAKRSEIQAQTALESVALADGAEITVFRLVQEALTNIAKYARASQVTVTLAPESGRALVTVRDNGIGFNAKAAPRSAHGLTGMRYRVEGHGGAMRITSTPGHGTTIEAWLPVVAPASAPPPT
jgi:signal transduction histidine kinase